MMFGGGISPIWGLVLGLGLAVFLTFFVYVILFEPGRLARSGSGPLQKYESAWWNHKLVLWAFFILFVATELPFWVGSALSVLSGGSRLFRSPFDFALGMAFGSPLLSILVVAFHTPVSSFLILVLLLVAMSRSPKGVWLARHFTQAFILITLSLLAVQGFGLFLVLKRYAGG